MVDRPILFSGAMVRALLEGRKTQTRRILKPLSNRTIFFDPKTAGLNQYKAPAFVVGDRLWVRETWSGVYQLRDIPPAQRESIMTPDGPILREDIHFWADGNPLGGEYEKPRPGIHMPRWASRLTLIVEGVKVERLQDISEADAIAEGCESDNEGLNPNHIGPSRAIFQTLWGRINGPGSWDANPFVAAYTFRVIRSNIDQIGGTP